LTEDYRYFFTKDVTKRAKKNKELEKFITHSNLRARWLSVAKDLENYNLIVNLSKLKEYQTNDVSDDKKTHM